MSYSYIIDLNYKILIMSIFFVDKHYLNDFFYNCELTR